MPAYPTLVCTEYTESSDGAVSCTQEAWIQAHILTPEEYQLLMGGIDLETMSMFFMGTLSLFCVGFGIGLIISHLRKAH